MANLFTGSEVVEIGIQIEKNGRDFYRTLANQSKNEKAVEIYRYLSIEEEKHIAVFEKILDGLEKYTQQESYPGEYIAYMNVLAGEYVFTQSNKGAEIAERVKSDKEAVDLGIGFEKDSIIFYEGMKKFVPIKTQEVLSALIEQEQGHLRKLSDLKKRL